MSLDAYKIAVRISLVEGVTRGLQLMSRHFKATDADAKALQARLNSIAKQAATGAAVMTAGFAGLALMKAPLEEAKLYQTELARFASLGFGAKVNQQAQAYAEGMRTIGTSTRDNMTLVSDAMAVFKNLDHAKMAAPIMARMKFANAALFGDAGGDRDSKFMDLLKVIEFRGGLSSDTEFARQADFAQKVISGSRGRVDATAMLQALKTGGVALSRRGNEQFYLGGEPLIQEFGGSRYGTAAMSIYQNLVQSRGTVTAQQELYRLGLLDPSKVEFNKLGQLKKALPGAFRGASILESQGEMALLQQVLLPAFAAKGVTSPEEVTRELGMILGNRTGSSLMGRIYQQQSILTQQVSANRNAAGINQMARLAAGTPQGQEINLEKREADLKLEIGRNILPLYVKGLELAAGAMRTLTDLSRAFPNVAKTLEVSFVVVSGLAVVGGGLTILSAGLRGLMILKSVSPLLSLFSGGIRFLAQAFAIAARTILLNPIGLTIAAIALGAYLVYNNWKEIWGALKGIWNDIKTGIVQLFHGDILGALSAFGRAFKLAFQTVLNTIIAGIDKILPSALQIDKLHFADAQSIPGGTVRPSGQLVVHATVNNKVDAKGLATSVAAHLGSMASGPNIGVRGYDSQMHPLRPGQGR